MPASQPVYVSPNASGLAYPASTLSEESIDILGELHQKGYPLPLVINNDTLRQEIARVRQLEYR